jgi:NAD(P)-dependent dehydrogenase (short-subunit alcohol dehydrogenase family)
MTVQDLSSTTALVTGASRGFGRAISAALVAAGAHVVGVARNPAELNEVQGQLGDAFTAEVADVTDADLAAALISRYSPSALVLNAGTGAYPAPLQDQTWETFRQNWDVDVKHVFHFTREALVAPLSPGSVVVSVSSGAALRGSPLSGGYAGAKAMVKFLSAYAASEARRASLGIRFVSVLPQITPTGIAAGFVEAYAKYDGLSVESYLGRMGGALTVEQVGNSVVELVRDDANSALAYLITPQGLSALDQ